MVTTDPVPGEATAEEPRQGIGCGVLGIAVLVAVVLTIAQSAVLSDTWTSCEWGYGLPGDHFPEDGAHIGIIAVPFRLIAYVAASVVGVFVSRRWIRRSGPAGTALRILTFLAVCAVLFVADYAWGIRMDPGDYNPAHCPGGVPRWWPF